MKDTKTIYEQLGGTYREENGSLVPDVELSYLPHELQDKIVEIFERDEATPCYSQTVRFRRLHSDGKLTADTIEDIMAKPKAHQVYQIQLRENRPFLSSKL